MSKTLSSVPRRWKLRNVSNEYELFNCLALYGSVKRGQGFAGSMSRKKKQENLEEKKSAKRKTQEIRKIRLRLERPLVWRQHNATQHNVYDTERQKRRLSHIRRI